MTPQELLQHLKRQITFLRNSVAAYDRGSYVEAIRMAVVIRVLFYDTSRSTSLLKKMGKKDSLQLVTTAKKLPPNFPRPLDFGELLAGMVFGETIHYAPIPTGSPTLLISDWWCQPVFIHNDKPYTRGDVVRAAAHKDGGAHVDEPDVDLKAFRDGFWMKVTKDVHGREVHEPMRNTHFRMLRRFADEILKSPDLLALEAEE